MRGKDTKPYIAYLELTNSCNFSCYYCFLKRLYDKRLSLNYSSVKRYIDELVQAETVTLVLTGGEVLKHKDFEKIWKYAVDSIPFVIIYTNGSLISDYLDLFETHRPYRIEISLYGFSSKTYKSITGTDNFKNVFNNIKMLQERNIPLKIKYNVCRRSVHDLDKAKEEIQRLNIPFGVFYNILIHPGLDENKVRLNTETIYEKKLIQDSRVTTQNQKRGSKLYKCNSSKKSIYIGSDGKASICVFDKLRHAVSLNGKNIINAFYELQKVIRNENRIAKIDRMCRECVAHEICFSCPAISYFEKGTLEPVKYFCKIAKGCYEIEEVRNENPL